MGSSKPIFSVVIPTYNRAERLRDTLLSVLQQHFKDFEIVVIDDGSVDDSQAVCDSLCDDRIKYTWQENAGPAAARNNGVSIARGQYIAYLDSDDRWHRDYLLEARNQLVEQGDNHFLYGQIVVDRGVDRYWIKPQRGKSTNESIYEYLYLNGGFMQTSTLVVPKPLADQVSWEESITFGDNDQYAIDLCNCGATPLMQKRALVWYLDICSGDALSQLFIHDAKSERYQRFFSWMESHYPRMSAKSVMGFEAHFLSGVYAWRSPLRSWRYLLRARLAGATSSVGFVRQVIQNYAPKQYRRLTNTYVSWRGLSVEETAFKC